MSNLLSDWLLQTSDFESPDLLIEWGWYSLISAHIQRRIWLAGNSHPITKKPTHNTVFLNQFIAFVAPPSVGKTRITKNVQGFCEHPENKRVVVYGKDNSTATFDAVYCTPESITFEGLFQYLARPAAQDTLMLPYTENGEVKYQAYSHNSAFANIEELGVMFSKNTEDVASFMTQAYDAGRMRRHTKTSGQEDIANVCVNFLAGTTTKDLRRLIASEAILQGLSTRCIFVYASEPRFYRYESLNTQEKHDASQRILTHINALVCKIYGEIDFTEEAREFMKTYYESGKLRKTERTNFDQLLDGYYGRKKLHLWKLSAAMWLGHTEAFDVVDTRPIIHPIPLWIVMKALELLRRTEISMHLCFRDGGENSNEEVSKEVIAYMKTQGEVTYKKLYFNFYKQVEKDDLDRIMQYLMMTEQVSQVNGGNFKVNEQCQLTTTTK